MLYLKALKLRAMLLFACCVSGAALAQSSRPGWGSTPYHDPSGTGVTFRVWAPNATSVFAPGQFNNWSTTANPLAKEFANGSWTGVWSADVPIAAPGQQYKFFLNTPAGGLWKHDPRSRLVTYSGSSAGANDIIYDPTAFNWRGDLPAPRALNDLVIYELHIGTFNTTGSASKFLAATNRLDYLKNLGVSAVEVMPVAEFPTDNSWGYNPSQLFAVENVGFGGADGFKIFVQACHQRGLAVLLDVVHNHYGPSDLEMWNFDGYSGGGLGGGIYFNESNSNLQNTPYGATRPNFSSPQVDNFIQDNFTLWLNEYHVDGFRWDTPGLMMNADNYGYIPDAGTLINNINSMIHSYPGKISIAEDVFNAFGFDSAWDTTYPYSFTPQLTTTTDANRDMNVIANAVQYNVRYGGTAGQSRVTFLETHDVVGGLNGGKRLVTAIDSATPNSYWARKISTLGAAVTLTAPGVPLIFQGQEMLENQAFDSALPVDWTKTNTYSRIVSLYSDLISARRNLKGYTPGLLGNQCSILQLDNTAKLIAFRRWNSSSPDQGVVVIANFANALRQGYIVNFPAAGNWYTHLNTDSTNYSTDYGNLGSAVVTTSGNPAKAGVTIAPYSVLILSQTPDAPPQLTVVSTNSTLKLSWPGTYTGWTLYASQSLTGNSAWLQVPPAQYQTAAGTTTVTISPSNAYNFYRLQRL